VKEDDRIIEIFLPRLDDQSLPGIDAQGFEICLKLKKAGCIGEYLPASHASAPAG
jgi:hypothetical protein